MSDSSVNSGIFNTSCRKCGGSCYKIEGIKPDGYVAQWAYYDGTGNYGGYYCGKCSFCPQCKRAKTFPHYGLCTLCLHVGGFI